MGLRNACGRFDGKGPVTLLGDNRQHRSYLFGRRNQIIALAARHSLPTIYDRREFAAAGGLIAYGTHLADAYRHIGVYAGRILKTTAE